MITPRKMVFADSRARYARAIDSRARDARVISSLHMHFSSMRRALFKGREGIFARAARVQGPRPWCLRGMSEAKRPERASAALSAPWGSAVGGRSAPYKPLYRESVANGANPLNRMRVSAWSARTGAPGHSIYLILTVPIDTILIINELQIIQEKIWCQIVLFLRERI